MNLLSLEPYINLVVALFGLAYPIILQVIARLDEKYESENVIKLLKSEMAWKLFNASLIASVFSIVVWSLNFEPIITNTWIDRVLNNSASIVVVTTTMFLIFCFIHFIRKILVYYNPYELIPYLKIKLKVRDSNIQYFAVLADILLLTIKRKQTNLSRTLSDIFYLEFKHIRDSSENTPITYPALYYETVYRAIEELAILKEKRNYFLAKRASGGIWLLGEQTGKSISDKTYYWLWQNLLLAIRYKQDDLIVNHWETCHQYYWLNFYSALEDNIYTVTSPDDIHNNPEIKLRLKESRKFKEFHFALGGLLMYKKRYKCIKRLFDFTLSEPAQHFLLPNTMQEIIDFYNQIRDPYGNIYLSISDIYPFPELDGVKADWQIQRWIMSFLAVLFLRQYTIKPYLTLIKPLGYPAIPKSQRRKKEWLETIASLKILLRELLDNEKVLLALNLEFITIEWCEENRLIYPLSFLEEFEKQLNQKYLGDSINLEVSHDRINNFFTKTTDIIESTINNLSILPHAGSIEKNQFEIFSADGGKMLQSKDVFSIDPEIEYINYDSILAEKVSNKIKEFYAQTFLFKTTRTYILRPEDLFKGVEKIAKSEEYVIINFGIYLNYHINSLNIIGLRGDSFLNLPIYSFVNSQLVKNSLYILKKRDLPFVVTCEISNTVVQKYGLKKISDNYNLFASVINLTDRPTSFLEELDQNTSLDDLKKSVMLCIFIFVEFLWKRNIEVTQLIQYSEYSQKGIVNSLDDIR